MLDLQNALLFIAASANLMLGIFVWSKNKSDRVHITFGLFSLLTVLWIVSNYILFNGVVSFWTLSMAYALGALVIPLALVWITLLFYKRINRFALYSLATLTTFLFILTLIPGAVVQTVSVDEHTGAVMFVSGRWLFLYTTLQITMYATLLFVLLHGVFKLEHELRIQRILILVGVLVFGVVSIITSFLSPFVGDWTRLFPYDAQSSLFLTVFSTYAIFKHRLFNLRLLTFEVLTILLWAMLLFRVFTSDSPEARTENILIFILSLFVGYLIIWTGKREMINREKRERLTRYLANANARLRQLDKQKTEFLSIASHQLRSPIAAIKGYSSLLAEGAYGEVPDKLEEPLSRVLESGKSIAIMVDDFLNVTRIEQGRMKYAHVPVDLIPIVAAAVDDLQVMSEGKHLDLTFESLCTKPVCVIGDEAKLKQAFSNLVDNAIKYTQEGWIHVSVTPVPSNNAVLIKVADSGIGIEPEERDRLFRKFSRASNANTATVYGTGLGLYIAKEIIKAHSGWIHVSSEGPFKGSTFSVELPVARATEQVASAQSTHIHHD